MRKSPLHPIGKVQALELDSVLLAGNTAGDPSRREVMVYTPPNYDPARRYPLLMDLVGYTGSGRSHTNWKPFGYNLPERLDRLIHSELMPPVIAVMPDCFTCYGGNQYINSTATGPYMDYLCQEVLGLVETEFAVASGREHRAVFGKSSGGYGALIHGMLRADVWGAIACHSGDAYFEYSYMHDFPLVLKVLLGFDGSLDKFLDAIWAKEKLSGDEGMALMLIGMAAHYDPDPQAPHGFQLPFDTHTGLIRWDRWERWLKHDPVRLLEERIDALRSLNGLYIDCGTKDQFALLWGARIIHQRLTELGVPHEYQEFDDDHSDVDYRMDVSLPYLANAIAVG